jgi:subtilisin family serine protease
MPRKLGDILREGHQAVKKQKMRTIARRVLETGIAALSFIIAFVGWGLFENAIGKDPASIQNTTDRDTTGRNTASKTSAISQSASTKKEMSVLFNDPFISEKWGLVKTESNRAWEISVGSKDIVTAIIDTGVDVHHLALVNNLWTNPGESGKDAKGHDKATNGIDDDGNGYIDDVHGWNFAENNNSLTDNHGHGTHIAGIIGATGEGPSHITGVAPKSSLMILKYYDPKSSSTNNLKATIQAIQYAIKMKANVINYSGGGTEYSAEEFAAVKAAEKAGILFVAAAGNEHSNSDDPGKHFYPADYGLSNIISVTAVNKEETKVLSSSNYGVRTVDIAAPGENINSTVPGGGVTPMTGTSQATAFVTGVAVLIMAHNRDFQAPDVKKYILRTGDEYKTLISKTGSAKLLNSYKALVSLDKGVAANGAIANNTERLNPKAFSLDQDFKDPKLNTSAMNHSGSDGSESEEQAEALSSFGKGLLRALNRGQGRGPSAE